jgi:ribosomal protein S18 acetylase RimI-like enzyme
MREASGGVAFRLATEDDVDAVVALVESAYRGESSRAGWTTEADYLDGRRTDATAVRAALRGTARILLACRDDEIVGCCQIDRYDGAAAHFGMFAVRPTLQGGGVGRAIVAEAERIARDEWGCARMRMTVIRHRDELLAWYERLGYARTGKTEPFPYGDERFGLPKRDDLEFVELAKPLR